MPFRRCKFYLDDGTPTKGGCHREATGECAFIHPSDPNWRDAPEPNSTSNRAPPRGGANGDSTSAWNTTSWYTDTGGGSAPAPSSMTGANRTPVATTGPGAGWGRAARTAAAPPSSSFSTSGTGGWGKSGGEARPIWGDSGGAGAGAGGAGVGTGNTAGWDDGPGWGDGGGWGSGTDAASGWGVGAGRAESATLAEPPAGSSRAGNPPTAPRKDRPTPNKDRAGTAINLPSKPAWEWGKTGDDMVWDDVASTTSARSKVGTNKTASGVSSANLQPPQPVAAANSKPVSQEPSAISTQSSHDRIRITIPDAAVQGRTRSASTKSALVSPVAEFSPLDNAGMPPSNATEDIANATTSKQPVPLTDIHVLRTLLRAAQIRQDRDESGRQYEQWKVAQRSRIFVSVGKAARDELDRRAAELKQNYKAEEKLLATLIDTLAKTPENAQYLAMAPAISEVRRLAEDSKEWLDLVRPHLFVMSGLDPSKEGRPASPPPPLPPSFPSSVPLPSSTAGRDVEMLEDNEVVEAEMGEILPEKPRRPSSSGQISGQRPPGRNLAEQFQTRLQVLEDRFDEFEVNHPSASSIDVDQLLKSALEARALEEGKFRESARTAREATLEALRTKYELLNSKLQEVAKESQGLRNKLQGTQTELASWRTEVDRLKARDSESTLRLDQLGTAIEQGQQDIAQKTNKLQELHLTHNPQQQQQQQDKEPPPVTPQLLVQVQNALQARLQNDMRASANAMRESVLKHVHACDERLFTDLLKRLQPTLAITNAVFRRLDGDPTTNRQ